jgi:hypothetical protein
MAIWAIPAVLLPSKNIQYTLKDILIMGGQSMHVIQTNGTFSNIGSIKGTLECHLDSTAKIRKCVTSETRLELLHRLYIAA